MTTTTTTPTTTQKKAIDDFSSSIAGGAAGNTPLTSAQQTAITQVQAQFPTSTPPILPGMSSSYTTPGAGIVSSSTPTVQNENAIASNVATMMANYSDDGSLKKAHDEYTGLLDTQHTSLSDQLKAQQDVINSQYDTEGNQLADTQANETGSYGASLARIGGYLGNSASGLGAMVSLNRTHAQEVATLAAKRSAALQAAAQAVQDKQFDLAKSKAQDAKDYENELYTRKNTYLDQQLKLVQNDREAKSADLANKTAQYNLQSKQSGDLAASVVASIAAQKPSDGGAAIIAATAKQFGIDPALLGSSVAEYQQAKNKEIATSILGFAKDHPDAGISLNDVNSGDIGGVLAKVTSSESYKNANAYDKAKTDKVLADITEQNAKNDPASQASLYTGYAKEWADSGKPPTGIPAGSYGVVQQLAMRESARVGTGTIIDKNTGIKKSPAELIGATNVATVVTGSAQLLRQMQELQSFSDQVKTSPATGTIVRAGKLISLAGDDAIRYKAITDSMLSTYAQVKSGLAVSDKERDNLAQQLPNLNNYKNYNDAIVGEFVLNLKTGVRNLLDLNNATLKGIDTSYTTDQKKEDQGFEAERASVFDTPDDTKQSFNSVGGDTKKATGIIQGYDITSYATDPNHEARIATITQTMPPITTPQDADAYIKKVAPNSPVKGADVFAAAQATSTPPNLIMALMQQDSSFGTQGKAVRTKNPGNVGNTDDGSTNAFSSWTDGVFAVARNLQKRKV